MDHVASPEPVVPQPGVLRTIGVLNVLVGGVLLLVGLGYLKLTAPLVVSSRPLEIEPVTTQAFFEEMRRQRIDDLHARERAAEDERDRERIGKEREEVEASHP